MLSNNKMSTHLLCYFVGIGNEEENGAVLGINLADVPPEVLHPKSK